MTELKAIERVIRTFIQEVHDPRLADAGEMFTPAARIHRYEGGRCESLAPADYFAALLPQAVPAPDSLVIQAIELAGGVAHACASHALGGVPVTDYFALEKAGDTWMIASRSYHFEPRGDVLTPGRHAA